MSIEISDEAAERILKSVQEGQRLKKLSDEDLVREYFHAKGAEDDLLGEEMCSRLWPD